MVLNVIIRVDASINIGSGHVMRCLVLAEMLKEERVEVCFICKNIRGNLIGIIKDNGFKVLELPNILNELEDADKTVQYLKEMDITWIVIDHYSLGEKYESIVRPFVNKIMVIDDLANRKHDCDLLLDQNFYSNMRNRYNHLVSSTCKKYLGPNYLLLRQEFNNVKGLTYQPTQVSKILIFYGGSDQTNETEKVLTAIKQHNFTSLAVDVVVGSSNLNISTIKKMCTDIGATFHYQINYITKLMVEADVSFGAGGITMWERCYLGLPSIVTIVAENQRKSVEDTHEHGAIINIGWHENITEKSYIKVLKDLREGKISLVQLSERSRALVRNNGCLQHPIVKEIIGN
nr:UDP-2,4-diacetamido-2,4,6-trideoxy-beta-L-altropyranose hydrolase [Evansella cellulosilytica]